jgi:hypothetical protein
MRRRDMAKGRMTLYEHKNCSLNGRVRKINLEFYSENALHSLHAIDFKDCLSSLRWTLPSDVTVVFYQHDNGSGGQYIINNIGHDDVHNNDFGDCASSWRWYK